MICRENESVRATDETGHANWSKREIARARDVQFLAYVNICTEEKKGRKISEYNGHKELHYTYTHTKEYITHTCIHTILYIYLLIPKYLK